MLPRFRICVRCQTLRNVPVLLPMTRTGVSKYSEGQVGRQVHLTQCHRWPNPLTVHSTQLHLGQCDTGSVRHTWIFEKPFQLAVGPLKKRFSSKLSPKGGPGSCKTQFLSSGLYGLEVGRLPSWTAKIRNQTSNTRCKRSQNVYPGAGA